MKVLVTGANGYVGSGLVPRLLEAGHQVVAGVRREDSLAGFPWAGEVEQRYLDVEDVVSVHVATRGVDAVIYLIHSMASSGFVKKDREGAEYVAAACARNGVERVVYLSGLIPPDVAQDDLSEHLRSRLEVEQVLLAGEVPATVLRAAIVVGAGSTSFEIVRRLSELVPLTPIPTWMRRSLQPVAIDDVYAALLASLEGPPRNRPYDLGGADVVTYPELLERFAALDGLNRRQVPVPLVPQRVVGEVVALLSGESRSTVVALVQSLPHDMVCEENDIREDLMPGHVFLGLDEAITRALAE